MVGSNKTGPQQISFNAPMTFLRNVFSKRIIPKNVWLSRSPDLTLPTPSDFFLWVPAEQTVSEQTTQD
ncbi:hypothetical protein J6590_032361 [Homalodisca vitripennis]|nr:hypothetical protein J6590_032361 [Homalodisca vitripennis]